MSKYKEIERPLSPDNAVVYGVTVGLELAVLECNHIGIELEGIDTTDFRRPRLVARDNRTTRYLMKTGKAQNYGSRVKNGRRIYLNHTQVKGVRVVWESQDYRH
ncbi:hypothetical protein [Actinobacillus pleuropneumoniae]|uniref:hypothetical protein n=1 Tax=Actinobacillus pleuropneumoniae TaxID=715 RepID=UPI003B02CB55